MQLVAEDFNKRMNRYPTGKELTGLLQNICAYNEGVSPYQTDKIVSTFDNSGGWLYDRTSGAVKINYNGKYPIGFRSWVDVSKVNFYIPVKVDAISHGKFETLDFSSLSNWLNSEQPEIQKIITNWATTNVVKTGSKNIVGLDASAQN